MYTPSLPDHGQPAGNAPLVLIFAPSERAPAYEEQIGLIDASREAWDARGVVIATCFWEGACHLGQRKLSGDEVHALRDRFDVSKDAFRIVVVGADDTVKLHDGAPLKPQAILDALDAEPQRS